MHTGDIKKKKFSDAIRYNGNKKEMERVDLKALFHGKNIEKKLNQSFLDSKFSSSPSHTPKSSKKPVIFKPSKPVVHINQRNTIFRRKQVKLNSRNSEARRSIAQTVQQANKTNFEFLKRCTRLVARCKLIFLKLAYSSYVKLRSSKKKIRLLYPGVQQYSGTKVERKIISAIKKRLNNNAVVFETLKLDFQSSLPQRSNRSMNRNRMSINMQGDRTSFFKQLKSRNFKLDARNWSISNPSSSPTTPTMHSFNQTFSMFPNRR